MDALDNNHKQRRFLIMRLLNLCGYDESMAAESDGLTHICWLPRWSRIRGYGPQTIRWRKSLKTSVSRLSDVRGQPPQRVPREGEIHPWSATAVPEA